MRDAERRVSDARSPTPLELLKADERAQIAYFRYIGAKASLEPELSDLAREARCRLDHWYRRTAEYEPNWVAAGRPREQI